MTSRNPTTAKRQRSATPSEGGDKEPSLTLDWVSPFSGDVATGVDDFPESIVVEVSHETSPHFDDKQLPERYVEDVRDRCKSVAQRFINDLYSRHQILPFVSFSGANVTIYHRRSISSSKSDQRVHEIDDAVSLTLVQSSLSVLHESRSVGGIQELIHTSIAIVFGKADIQCLVSRRDHHKMGDQYRYLRTQVFGPACELARRTLKILPHHGLIVLSQAKEDSSFNHLKDHEFDGGVRLRRDRGQFTNGAELERSTALYWVPSGSKPKSPHREPLRSEFARLLRSESASIRDPRLIDPNVGRLIQSLPDKLDEWTGHWQKHRLWDINLAPELVGHGKEHSQSVERLLSSLVSASDSKFSRWECGILSVAAWLHDWGHVGGEIARIVRPGPELANVTDKRVFLAEPVYVRALHGPISQNLIESDWAGMHNVQAAISKPAAILAGHHQSWTSFTNHPPRVFETSEVYRTALRERFDEEDDVRAPSLRDDTDAYYVKANESLLKNHGIRNKTHLYRKFQFLLALLRVADGADLGIHRVTDHGEDRVSFLGRCLYREALRLRREVNPKDQDAFDPVLNLAEEISNSQSPITDLQSPEKDPFITQPALKELLAQKRQGVMLLHEYLKFIRLQAGYFDKHASIARVDFEKGPTRKDKKIQIDVYVTPSDDEEDDVTTSYAAKHVIEDITKELNENDVRNGETIGDVLSENGYWIGNLYLTTDPRQGYPLQSQS